MVVASYLESASAAVFPGQLLVLLLQLQQGHLDLLLHPPQLFKDLPIKRYCLLHTL